MLSELAFVFPGQGSQYPGMGFELYKKHPFVQLLYDQAQELTGIDIKKLCFRTGLETLTETANTQLAIFMTSYAAFRVFMEEGISPSFMAGHSLGEITALACAEAIDFNDAIQIVRIRGRIMQEATKNINGGMAAVKGMDIKELEHLCDTYGDLVGIANYNTKEQIVISGDRNTLLKIADAVQTKNGKYSLLKVSAPFHSHFMKDAATEFAEELNKFQFHNPKYPVISNVSAKPYRDHHEIREVLTAHLIKPVLWIDTMDYLVDQQIKYAFEFGPKKIISNLIRKHTDKIESFSYDEFDDRAAIQRIISSLTGKRSKKELIRQELKLLFADYVDKINNLELANNTHIVENITAESSNCSAVTLCLASAVCTPNFNTSKEEYHAGVLEPYNKIRRLQAKIEREQRGPDISEVEQAFLMLYTVFQTKGVSYEEQKLRVEKIYEKLITIG